MDDDLQVQEADAANLGTAEADIDALIRESSFQFGDFDPHAYGATHGMSKRMVLFGIGMVLGLNQTKAYAMAGYSGNGSGARAAASKLANGDKMRRFLEAATKASEAVPKGPLTKNEKRTIFAKIGRSANHSTAIRALEADERLESEPEDDPSSIDKIVDWLSNVAREGPRCAVFAQLMADEFFWMDSRLETFDAGAFVDERMRHDFYQSMAGVRSNIAPLPEAGRW